VSEDGDVFDRYPAGTVLISNAIVAATWVLGAYILWAALGAVAAAVFIAYCVVLEANLLRKSCVHCHYYGKTCFSGRGKLCGKLLKKGSPEVFASRTVSWKDLLPDMVVAFLPIICGMVLLIIDFSLTVLMAVIILLVLATAGNAVVRGRLACRHCRQRLLGCPAEKLFRKETGAERTFADPPKTI